uniref:AlNc14C298G10337 protein n=1 Tax=Albugo laibachii Nc14 TaxID=890382 RepID=F0WVK2_9STRA|nr:AlNc14C298G10337 [Albugo laibachii Nc14]|eukprot:CCA25444.1 AlNc14C298G10337 [Albugo laibachii Nc14]
MMNIPTDAHGYPRAHINFFSRASSMLFSIFGLYSNESAKLDEIQEAFLQTRKTNVLENSHSMEFSKWELFKQTILAKLVCWDTNVVLEIHQVEPSLNEQEYDKRAELNSAAGCLANEFMQWRERISSTQIDENCANSSDDLTSVATTQSDSPEKKSDLVHSVRPKTLHLLNICANEKELRALKKIHAPPPLKCKKNRSKKIKLELRSIVCFMGVVDRNRRHLSMYTKLVTKKRKREGSGMMDEESQDNMQSALASKKKRFLPSSPTRFCAVEMYYAPCPINAARTIQLAYRRYLDKWRMHQVPKYSDQFNERHTQMHIIRAKMRDVNRRIALLRSRTHSLEPST